MAIKKWNEGDSYLCSQSLLLVAMAIVVLAAVALGGVCGLSSVRSCGGWRSNLIEKEIARKMYATGNSYLCLRPLILYAVVNVEQGVNSICCNDESCVNATGGVLR